MILAGRGKNGQIWPNEHITGRVRHPPIQRPGRVKRTQKSTKMEARMV
jgi:hypothetical protein